MPSTAYAAINTIPARRPAAAHLPHPRRRQDLAAHHHRHSRRRHHQRRPRGPGAPRLAVRRLRAGGLRVVRRRRSLAVAAAEHAGDVDPRSGRSRTTTSSSARTGDRSGSSTTSRRCGRCGRTTVRRGRAPVPAAGRRWRFRWNKNTDTPLPPDEPARREPARRRDRATTGSKRIARSRSRSRSSTRGGAVVRRYSSADAPEPPIEGRNTPDYWLRPHADAIGEGGIPSLRLGRASRAAGGGRLLVSDRGDQREHAAHAVWIVGVARHLHGAADGRRQGAHPAAGREDGSAREDDRGRSSCSTTHRARSTRCCGARRRRCGRFALPRRRRSSPNSNNACRVRARRSASCLARSNPPTRRRCPW